MRPYLVTVKIHPFYQPFVITRYSPLLMGATANSVASPLNPIMLILKCSITLILTVSFKSILTDIKNVPSTASKA